MLAAMLTVSGPWLPARWRHWWWALLLAFVPIHLVVSAVVPARSLLGLAVGWFVGALVVLVVGTPALEVPLDGAVRAMARRGCTVTRLTVVRPAGPGALILTAKCADDSVAELELYGPNQRSGGVLCQLWRKFTLRGGETAPFHASMRRAVEHRALMAIAIDDLGVANTSPLAVAPLSRGWTLYAHTPARGVPLAEAAETTLEARVWGPLRVLHDHQISHGDLRANKITVDDGTVLFGGFDHAEYGATDAQLQSDIAQLMVTTSALYDPATAVRTAMGVFGKETVLTASRRLTKAAVPKRIRDSIPDARGVLGAARDEVKRQTGADEIQSETITRFNRNQIIQMVLLVALVYVALPFISTVPTFLSELRTANWWWGLLGLAVSALKYVGAAAALWACADGLVSFRNLTIMQVANTFAATTTPAGVGGLALSVRFLQKGGLGALRAATAVTLQQSVQVVTHVVLLILFSAFAGASADLTKFVPSMTIVYLVGGAILVVVAAFGVVPRLRNWLTATVGPRVKEVLRDLRELAGEPRRLVIIVAWLRRNDSGRCPGPVGMHLGIRRRHLLRHGHGGDDDRRHPRLGSPHPGWRRRSGGCADRWAGSVRGARRDRRVVGAALPGSHVLAARVRRLVLDALDDRKADDLAAAIHAAFTGSWAFGSQPSSQCVSMVPWGHAISPCLLVLRRQQVWLR